MTLKLEGDRDTLKMYLHTESEAAILRDSELLAWIEKIRKCLKVKGQGQNAKSSELYFERYRNRYSDQAPTISDQ